MKTATVTLGFMMSYLSGHVLAFPTEMQIRDDFESTSPFHDCLDTGKTFNECRYAARMQTQGQELKRSEQLSTSPFHDCMDGGSTWSQCIAAARLTGNSNEVEAVSSRGLEVRNGIFQGAIDDLGQSLGGSEQCYSANNLKGTGWLTNTAVKDLKTQACTFAVNQAITAGTGKFTTTKSGFYQGGFGPISTPKVKYFMSVLLLSAELANVNVDVKQLAIDLCTKGVDHLVSDKGCTAQRKALGIVEHTSVNGGEYDWALNGQQPQYDNTGVCENCVMTMVMEAANMVDKDGKTATPIDG